MDSANILSILASLGQGDPNAAPQGPPTNVLQAAAPVPAPMPQEAPQPAPMPPQAPPADPAAEAPAQPHRRRSLLDTIGRITDVLAKVGGAEPLYQPTLDAREDRTLKLGDHDRQVTSDTLKIATDKFALGSSQNLRLGQAARGLKAIQAAGGDITKAWPVLAQRLQLDPETTAAVGQGIAADPNSLDGLIAATNDPKYDQSKYGGSVVYAKNKDGKLVAYQPSLSADSARSILPDGVEPIDPLHFVDTGAAQVGVGTRSGNATRILPKSVTPDARFNAGSRERIAAAGNASRERTAALKTNGKAGTGDDGNVPTLLDNIQSGFNDLHKLSALPGEGGSAVGQVEGAIGRSALGQKVGEQFGRPSAQKRLEIMKNVSALQQAMLKSLPASATRTKFEQEMLARGLPDPSKMDLATANTVIRQLRESYAQALAASKKTTTAAPAARPATVRPQPKSGWTIVGVK